MPFDPLSAGVAAAGMIVDLIKSQQAKKAAEAAAAEQRRIREESLGQAQVGKIQSLASAGSLRQDQFGNATYYDPESGRWITHFTPTQQRLIDQGQERQGRAQARGAQASSDYDRLRGEYLYQKPKGEATAYKEIVDLINAAQGSGERQLNTLMNRWGTRTAGNIPTIQQLDNGPDYSQQLAETMLKARGSALDESIKRQAAHTSQYLPALKQFEDTANYVAPVDPTGSAIIGMSEAGRKDQQKAMSDYDRLIATISQGGANAIGSASAGEVKAAGGGPGAKDFLAFAKMLMPTPEKAGKTDASGTSIGADDDGGGGSGSSLGGWDRRFNYGPKYNLSGKGTGGEGADIGITYGGSNTLGNPNYISPGGDPYTPSGQIAHDFSFWPGFQ